jgi:hypothetical protein
MEKPNAKCPHEESKGPSRPRENGLPPVWECPLCGATVTRLTLPPGVIPGGLGSIVTVE